MTVYYDHNEANYTTLEQVGKGYVIRRREEEGPGWEGAGGKALKSAFARVVGSCLALSHHEQSQMHRAFKTSLLAMALYCSEQCAVFETKPALSPIMHAHAMFAPRRSHTHPLIQIQTRPIQ